MWSLIRQYMWVADILGIILCAYFLANLAGLYMESRLEVSKSLGVLKEGEIEVQPRQKAPFRDYKIIVERNIFDSTTAEQVESPSEETTEKKKVNLSGEAVKTSLNINVLGVVVVGKGVDPRSTATVSTGKGKAEVYAVGDENGFAPETKLTKISPKRIEFINKSQLEYAEITDDFGKSIFGKPEALKIAENAKTKKSDSNIKKEAPGKYVVDQSEVDQALANLDKLYTEIRAVPNFSGGKISGMKILSVKRGSIFAKLGLKRGDILKRVNGMELDVRRGFQIFGQLKDQKTFNVDLTRRGQPVTLEYEVR